MPRTDLSAADGAPWLSLDRALGLIDKIVHEPLGGAHRDPAAMGQSLKKALQDSLKQLSSLSTGELLEARFARLMAYGRTKEQALR